MNILVINCGSSSIKFSIFNLEKDEEIFKSEIKIFSTIENELEKISEILKKAENPPIDAISHRVIHGGNKFHDSAIINDEVIAAIKSAIIFAPQHNPLALAGIAMAKKIGLTCHKLQFSILLFIKKCPITQLLTQCRKNGATRV